MKIHDILSAKQIDEGPNDPHIFKAVFLAGGPGSGKSFVANKMLGGTGLKVVNSDDVFEYLAKKNDLDLSKPDDVYSDRGQEVRNRAKDLTNKRRGSPEKGEGGYIGGRLGLIIDGTGKDVASVASMASKLQTLGYDTMMLFVNTDLEVAQSRNQQRDRRLPADVVTKMWQRVQQNLMKFQQVFGAANFHIIDNSGGMEDQERKDNFLEVQRAINNFLAKKPSKPAAKQWLDNNTR